MINFYIGGNVPILPPKEAKTKIRLKDEPVLLDFKLKPRPTSITKTLFELKDSSSLLHPISTNDYGSLGLMLK